MHKSWPVFLIAFAFVAFSSAAWADGNVDVNILQQLLGKPGKSAAMVVKPVSKDDALRLTSNKDKLIRLNQDAASVIVNNPAHATVMLDSPRLLIVMPRQPGATSFSVLNSRGDVILHKDIIVTNVQPKYVRVRRMCDGNDASCVPAAYYYCPDGCYEVTPVDADANSNIPPPVNPATTAAANAASMGGAQPPPSGSSSGMRSGSASGLNLESSTDSNQPATDGGAELVMPDQTP